MCRSKDFDIWLTAENIIIICIPHMLGPIEYLCKNKKNSYLIVHIRLAVFYMEFKKKKKSIGQFSCVNCRSLLYLYEYRNMYELRLCQLNDLYQNIPVACVQNNQLRWFSSLSCKDIVEINRLFFFDLCHITMAYGNLFSTKTKNVLFAIWCEENVYA